MIMTSNDECIEAIGKLPARQKFGVVSALSQRKNFRQVFGDIPAIKRKW
jgi:hypothetical protein